MCLSAMIAIFLVYTFANGRSFTGYVSDLDKQWDSYQGHRNEKTRLRSELISRLGYDGLIHHYDNFILRKTESYKIKAWISYGIVSSTLDKLIGMADTYGERTSLQDIKSTVLAIGENLKYVEQEIEKGTDAKDILSSIDMDYFSTTRSLKNLGHVLSSQLGSNKETEEDKTVIRMIAVMGLDGFIQSYKRYVILGDPIEEIKTREYGEKIKAIAAEYLNYDVSFGEKLAIEDILTVVNTYLSKLEKINSMLAAGASAEEIDMEVKVDDTKAIRGFSLLQAVNQGEIEQSGKKVEELIAFIIQKHSNYVNQYAAFLLMIILLFNYFSFQLVIKPIERISHSLLLLSEGKMEISVEEKSLRVNEIGKMQDAFNVFKKHEAQRLKVEKELKQLARTDPLTGLSNRNELNRRYSDIIRIAKRKNEKIAILALDLDNFKTVNDTYGHAVGDEFLEEVSEILVNETRDSDIVARIGGDEFAIVLYAPEQEEDVQILARRVIKRVSDLNMIDDSAIRAGVSIGICFDEARNCQNLKKTLSRADRALYNAKESGKNKVISINALIASASAI